MGCLDVLFKFKSINIDAKAIVVVFMKEVKVF